MPITAKAVAVSIIVTFLAACSVLQSTQSHLISHAFDQYLGKSAAEAKVFENTLVENRMEDLLGDNYQHTVDMLNTAQTIEKEGPMYYAISQASPEQKEQAGFVYNSDTNQMSVVTVKDNAAKLAYEKVNEGKEKITPPLPKAFASLMHPEQAVNNAINSAAEKARTQATDAASNAAGMNAEQIESLKNQANPDALKQPLQEKSDQAIDKAINTTVPASSK